MTPPQFEVEVPGVWASILESGEEDQSRALGGLHRHPQLLKGGRPTLHTQPLISGRSQTILRSASDGVSSSVHGVPSLQAAHSQLK